MTDQQPAAGGDVKNIKRFIAFVGILFILSTQFFVFSQPVDETLVFPPYIGLSVLGMGIFVLSQLIRPTPFLQRLSAHFLFQEKVFWIFVAVILSVLSAAAVALFMLYTRTNYIPVVTIWLLGALSYIHAFSNWAFDYRTFIVWMKNNRNEILALAAVMLLAFVLRFYQLGSVPRVLDGDEGRIGLLAQLTNSGPLSNPFALWENFGILYLQIINLSLRLFGLTPFALRLVPAIGGVLAVPALYLLARWIAGSRIALLTVFLLAISHTHIHFSRIVSVAYIQGTWLAPLELYLLYSGLQKRESWRTALAGVLLAIHFSVYLTAQVVSALVLVYMLIAFLFFRAWFKARLQQALVFWGGFLLMILPEAVYILKTPNEFFNRLSADGTFSGWLAERIQITGDSAGQILFERIAHAFFSLTYYPGFDFYGSPAPMLNMVAATFFLIGLGITLWRVRDTGFLLLNGYFWAATVSIGIFATPPSADSYRMLMALPAALIMTALGLDQILEYLGLSWKSARNAYVVSATVILLSLMVFNLWTYYGDFAGQCRFGDNLVSRFASYMGSYVKTISNEDSVYLLSNDQYFYGSHASTDFLTQVRPIINVNDSIDSLNPVSGETIIANPDRIPELEIWARAHPGGELHYEYDCKTTILLAYLVP